MIGDIRLLVSKEHVYVEGPPGAAKTLLAERTAELTRLRPFVYQMHRDTRLHEIVGDAVIIRSREPDGSEVIRQSTRPGGILSAQIAVLDDISRAPGEALNVLFRILNERRFAQGGDAMLRAELNMVFAYSFAGLNMGNYPPGPHALLRSHGRLAGRLGWLGSCGPARG